MKGGTDVLQYEAMLAEASALTGLDDFDSHLYQRGGSDFRQGLRVMIDSLNAESSLTGAGQAVLHQRYLNYLRLRLLLVDYHRRRLQGKKPVIERPIFILGLPRTGSTILFNLLSRHPDLRAPLLWETRTPPLPLRPGECPETDNRLIAEMDEFFVNYYRVAPDMKKIHKFGTLIPQECFDLLAQEFKFSSITLSSYTPSYYNWLLQQDLTSAYEYHKAYLQYLQNDSRRWLLKSPMHLGCLDALLAVYPDALIVQTHRHPSYAMPSFASLIKTVRAMVTDDIDKRAIGAEQLVMWALQMRRNREQVERVADRSQIIDIRYDDFIAEPVATALSILERAGLHCSEPITATLHNYMHKHPKNQHGRHDYNAQQFGLSRQQVERAFGDYCEVYSL